MLLRTFLIPSAADQEYEEEEIGSFREAVRSTQDP